MLFSARTRALVTKASKYVSSRGAKRQSGKDNFYFYRALYFYMGKLLYDNVIIYFIMHA